MSRPLPFDPIAEARRHWESRYGHDLAPSMTAVTSVMRAQQILMSDLNGILRPLDLTFPRYEALMLLRFSKNGCLALSKVGERLQIHVTSVTSVIDRLEKDGLVERVPHPSDRRSTQARITAEGVTKSDAATKRLRQLFQVALSPEDLELLSALTREIRLAAGDFYHPEAASVAASEDAPLELPLPR